MGSRSWHSLKGCALVLLRQTEEGAKLLEGQRSRAVTYGYLHTLIASDPFIGLCKIFQGDIGGGIRFIEEAILKREKEGNQGAADWYRGILSDVYLQIIGGNEKPPFSVLLKNLPILVKVTLTASSRIRAMATGILENPRYDPEGFWVGRAQMILGLLYKTKKKGATSIDPYQSFPYVAMAVKHLTEAKRILSNSDKPRHSRESMQLSRNWDSSVSDDDCQPHRCMAAREIFILLFVTPMAVRAPCKAPHN